MFSCSYCPLVTNFHVTLAGLGSEGAPQLFRVTPVVSSLSQSKNLFISRSFVGLFYFSNLPKILKAVTSFLLCLTYSSLK